MKPHAWKATVALDLDGVLFDFVNPVCEAFGLAKVDHHGDEEGLDYDFMYSHPTRMCIHRADQDEYINGLGATFWALLPVLRHARELVDAAHLLGPVMFITNPGSYAGAHEGKISALKHHGFFRKGDSIVYTADKHHHVRPGLLLVDDYAKNTRLWEEQGGDAALVRRPWTLSEKHTIPDHALIALLKTLEPLKSNG